METRTFVHGEGETTNELKKGNYNFNRRSSEKQKKIMKKRFSEEQIKCLEEMFEKERKLEPRRKMEVAQQLRLEPKQVAIWFQNKRARSKSHQLQTQFASLRATYDGLAREFDTAVHENQHLLSKLQELRAVVSEKHQECTPKQKSCDQGKDVNRKIDSRTGKEPDRKAGSSGKGAEHDDESMKTTEWLELWGNEELLLDQQVYSSASSDQWPQFPQCWHFC